jgi:hypothetical protein
MGPQKPLGSDMQLKTFDIGIAESTFMRKLDQTEYVNPPSQCSMEEGNLNQSIGANLL